MDLELKGKTAIVTGGNRGIGKAIAKELAQEGVNVAIVARDKTALAAAAKEVAGNSGVKVLDISSDTGDDAAVKKMVADVVAAFGRIDILVNCAAQAGGQGKPPSLTEITNEHFWADMNVKVLGYLRTAREVAPHMIKQGSGRIINVSGLAARKTGTIIGSMRNVSVAALTKNLADELGAARHLGRVRASGPHPHREDAGRGGGAGQGARRVGGRDREAHGRPQPGAQDHHRRGDRLRGGLPRLAQGGGAERRRHRRRRRRSRRDPLLEGGGTSLPAPLQRSRGLRCRGRRVFPDETGSIHC